MKTNNLLHSAVLVLLASCSKSDNAPVLAGSYVETTPNAGQRTLQFIPPDRMVFHERGRTSADSFSIVSIPESCA